MRDDVLVPQLADPPFDYDQQTFKRAFRDIELTLTNFRTPGPANTTDLVAEGLTVSGNGSIGGTLAVTGNTTIGGTLTVTGNTTFNGTLDINDDLLLSGRLIFDGSVRDILANVTDDRILISGSSTSASGANFVLWGSAHATEPNNMWLRSGATQIFKWDDTNTRFDFLRKVRIVDSQNLAIGTGEDLTIFHNTADSFISNSTGNLFIDNDQNAGTGLIAIRKADSGNVIRDGIQLTGTTPQVNLYHNGNLRLSTTSNGINVTNPNTPRLTLADETATNAGMDSRIQFLYGTTQGGYIGYPNVDDYYIQNNLPSGNIYIGCDNGAGIIYLRPNANNEAARADSIGLLLLDDKRIDLGNSRDLRLYHSSNGNGYIDNVAGTLHIRNRLSSSSAGVFIQDLDAGSNNHNCAFFEHDRVLLYFDNLTRLQTTNGGITVTGTVTETSDITLKPDWEDLSSQKAIEILGKWRAGSWTDQSTGKKRYGVNAQNIEETAPELVTDIPLYDDNAIPTGETVKGVSYTHLSGVLIPVINEILLTLGMDPIYPDQAPDVRMVKREAARRIYSVLPEWKQRNYTARGVEFLRKGEKNLTDKELAEANAIQSEWDRIKEIRLASNALETMNPIPTDYTNDKYWSVTS